MSKFQHFPLAAVALLALGQVSARADEAAKMMLQGTWIVTSAKANGEVAPDDDIKGMLLTFKGDQVIGTKDGKEEEPEPYVLSTNGGTLRITITEKSGNKYHGIIKFEDDGKKMIMCVTNAEEFPKNFDAAKPDKDDIVVMCLVMTKKQ